MPAASRTSRTVNRRFNATKGGVALSLGGVQFEGPRAYCTHASTSTRPPTHPQPRFCSTFFLFLLRVGVGQGLYIVCTGARDAAKAERLLMLTRASGNVSCVIPSCGGPVASGTQNASPAIPSTHHASNNAFFFCLRIPFRIFLGCTYYNHG